MNMDMLLYPIGASVLALLFAIYLIFDVLKKNKGSEKMVKISDAIKEGANSYMKKQYKTVAIVAVPITILLGVAVSIPVAVGFVAGAVCSAVAGYVGMSIAVRANVRTTEAAKKGLKEAMNVAVKGGAVTGMFVVGLALLGVTTFYWIYGEPILIVGFAFGASLISLFARIGGGIYTKAADVGADLVGKLEAGIPEDDPRNPAVIADNVGDNVGDCAGMGADLFETYAVTAIGAMLLGFLAIGANGVLYPLMLGTAAVIASIIGIFFIRVNKSIMRALYQGLLVSAVISAVAFYFITQSFFGADLSLFYASLVGIGLSLCLFVITEFYTSKKFPPVKELAKASQSGEAVNIIAGLALGLRSTALPAIFIVGAILLSFFFGGVYGIAIAVMAMLSLSGMIITLDSYGPITDNAGGIAEMAGLDKSVRKVTDELDAVGNTTKAVTKSFAIGSASLAALTLFAAYVQEVEIVRTGLGMAGKLLFSLNNPFVLAGLMIGGLIPFLFVALLMKSVGRAAFSVVEEVRRQFKVGLDKIEPDYARCVDIVTGSALREMVVPALIAVLAPLLVGFLLGAEALGAMLLGSIITGLLVALFMTTGGAAWDNAKKYIEDGAYGGKGSAAHRAAVCGDTVGDPTKDTAGPAINPLIKVMNTIAIIAITLIVMYALV